MCEMPSNNGEIIPTLLAVPFKMNSLEVRLHILQQGRPKPLLHITNKKDGVKGSSETLNPLWYETYQWLCGSLAFKKLYCWPCLLMRPETSSWSSTGVDELHRVSAIAAKHSASKSHKKAIAEYDGTMIEAGLQPEFVGETSESCKMERDSDSDSDVAVTRPRKSKRSNNHSRNHSDKLDEPSMEQRPPITFRAWQQATRGLISSKEDEKLSRLRRKHVGLEIKNAQLTAEKLKLEIQVLEAKLEYHRAIRIPYVDPSASTAPP